MENYNILQVKYIGHSNTKPSRVKIVSERFHTSTTFSFDSIYGSSLDAAQAWLKERGFNIIGCGEGKGHMYIITDTFKSLK